MSSSSAIYHKIIIIIRLSILISSTLPCLWFEFVTSLRAGSIVSG